jgi:hypothetical protein
MRWAQLIGGALFVVSVIALMPIVGSSTFRVELGKKAMPAYPEFQA